MASVRPSTFKAKEGVAIFDFDGTVATFGLEPDPKLLKRVANVGDEPSFKRSAKAERWSDWAEGDQFEGGVIVPLDLLERAANLPAKCMWAGSGGALPNRAIARLSADGLIAAHQPWPVLGSQSDGSELPNRSFEEKLQNVVKYALDNPDTAITWADDELGGRMPEVLDALRHNQLPKGQIELVVCTSLYGLQPKDFDQMEKFFASAGLSKAAGDNVAALDSVPVQRTDIPVATVSAGLA